MNNGNCFFGGGKVGQNTLKGTSKVASGVLFIEAVVTVSLSWGVKVRKYLLLYNLIEQHSTTTFMTFQCSHHFENRLLNGKYIHLKTAGNICPRCSMYRIRTYIYIYLKKNTK